MQKFNEGTLLEELNEVAATDYSEEELAVIFGISIKRINSIFRSNMTKMSYERAHCLKNIAIRKKILDRALDGDVPTLIYLAMTRLGATNI